MKESILKGKAILAVDDESDVLTIIEEELRHECPQCTLDKATSFEEATQKLAFHSYDLIILDIMGVRGFDLLKRAALRKLPVAMLTAHALTPDALKRSIELGARAYLPKEMLGEIVPFLEDILTYEYLSGWNRLLRKLEKFFKFRWGEYWKEPEEIFWKELDKKSDHIK